MAHALARLTLSPAVARIVRENALDLAGVVGTGPKGRILKGDALAALAARSRGGAAAAAVATSIAGGASSAAAAAAAASTGGRAGRRVRRDVTRGATFERVAPSGARRVIAARLTASKRDVPHAYASRTVSLAQLADVRRRLKALDGRAPSVNDFVVRAAAGALRAVPAVNVTRDAQGQLVQHKHSIDGKPGEPFTGALLTPIVARADTLSVRAISQRSAELIEKARTGRLKPQEYQGGTFCISNLGMFGVREFTAIINQPQCAILAVGGPHVRMIADSENNAEAESVVTVTLSHDVSAIDTDVAAKWLNEFALRIEEPALL